MAVNIKSLRGTTLVVIEQKGSDAIECRERFLAGCDIYRELTSHTCLTTYLLIVGGGNNGNSPEAIRSWCPLDLLDSLVINNEASNTHEKAISILEFIKANEIETVIQVTSLYHSLRAYLTTLCLVQSEVPNVKFRNYVSDSHKLSNIHFAVKDELLLATSIDDNLSFIINSASIDSCIADAKECAVDTGLRKYFVKRYAEASRIVAYSELGKCHLTTQVTFTQIADSYILI